MWSSKETYFIRKQRMNESILKDMKFSFKKCNSSSSISLKVHDCLQDDISQRQHLTEATFDRDNISTGQHFINPTFHRDDSSL